MGGNINLNLRDAPREIQLWCRLGGHVQQSLPSLPRRRLLNDTGMRASDAIVRRSARKQDAAAA
eukprot:5881823-Pleurochrysis_carterae.AAC.1